MKAQIILLCFIVSICSISGQDIPEEYLNRLEEALQFIEKPSVDCQVVYSSRFDMSNPNGKKPFSAVTRSLLTAEAGALWEEEILESYTQGEEMKEQEPEEEEQDDSMEMILPFGEDRDKFLISREGGNQWNFTPREEFLSTKNMTAGSIRTMGSGGAIRLEAEFVKPPNMIEEMHMDFIAGLWENRPVPLQMQVDGIGGFLIIRKVFHTTLSWEDFRSLNPEIN